jgi:dihydrofolate reductase
MADGLGRVDITLVAAASENDVIGVDGGLPWRLPDDLKHFKRVTLGRPVVMGRKTFDELFREPLKGRTNIVVSRSMEPGTRENGVVVVGSLADGIDAAREDLGRRVAEDPETPREISIIGGGEIYRQALPVATRIVLTRVHATVDGDTTFPAIPGHLWTLERVERHEADERHAYAFTFEWWVRRAGV